MFILRYSKASPYARKVRIAADVCGLSNLVSIKETDTKDPTNHLRDENPLGKIPVLILEDGTALYDSRVIIDYLDDYSGGGRLIPQDAKRKFEALKNQSLGDGINDAALIIRHEIAVRRPELRDDDFILYQQEKIDRALKALVKSPPQGPLDIGHISVACALGYLDLRFEGNWRKASPSLVDWLAAFSIEAPSFKETAL
ncbi:MAG: glutathione S-transferase family protein [Methylocystaceae bacterium]|jgi:glutathione S-transferase|nr:glutathione S-transferase family protein [Methylocystaceae bacterium]NBT96821.1 glutathione S-transferase family protein [Methylocystaceae bacterium]